MRKWNVDFVMMSLTSLMLSVIGEFVLECVLAEDKNLVDALIFCFSPLKQCNIRVVVQYRAVPVQQTFI